MIITGGCFCGNIRYEITGDPVIQLLCFCNDCQKTTGSSGYAGYMVKKTDFRKLSGTPTVHQKLSREGRKVGRHFCPTCGSNLWGVTEFGLISIAAGTFDDPDLFKPTRRVFVADAPAWASIPGDLEEM